MAMKYPPLTASSVFRNNQPNTWVVRVDAFGGPTVADCGKDGEKFAKLFAAAPQLLDALQLILEHLDPEDNYIAPDTNWMRDLCREAIAEATGASE
jgi:hypothetical protein